MEFDITKLSMSHLVALRDLHQADLRRAQQNVNQLQVALEWIKQEIDKRGNS